MEVQVSTTVDADELLACCVRMVEFWRNGTAVYSGSELADQVTEVVGRMNRTTGIRVFSRAAVEHALSLWGQQLSLDELARRWSGCREEPVMVFDAGCPVPYSRVHRRGRLDGVEAASKRETTT